MKRFFYACISLVCLFIGTTVFAKEVYYTNDYNISMTQQEYTNLLNLGFSENQIERMELETFNENKDLDATFVSKTVKYYRTITSIVNGLPASTTDVISEQEYINSQTNKVEQYDRSVIETSYKRLTTTIYAYDFYYRYRVDMKWLNMPNTRSYDIIGCGCEPGYVVINTGISFRQDYTYSNGTSNNSYSGYSYMSTTGGGFVFKLPSGSMSSLESYLHYGVNKLDPDETLTAITATGDYSHATSSISATNAQRYTVNHVNGIVLQSGITGYYDDTPQCMTVWTGTW